MPIKKEKTENFDPDPVTRSAAREAETKAELKRRKWDDPIMLPRAVVTGLGALVVLALFVLGVTLYKFDAPWAARMATVITIKIAVIGTLYLWRLPKTTPSIIALLTGVNLLLSQLQKKKKKKKRKPEAPNEGSEG